MSSSSSSSLLLWSVAVAIAAALLLRHDGGDVRRDSRSGTPDASRATATGGQTYSATSPAHMSAMRSEANSGMRKVRDIEWRTTTFTSAASRTSRYVT